MNRTTVNEQERAELDELRAMKRRAEELRRNFSDRPGEFEKGVHTATRAVLDGGKR